MSVRGFDAVAEHADGIGDVDVKRANPVHRLAVMLDDLRRQRRIANTRRAIVARQVDASTVGNLGGSALALPAVGQPGHSQGRHARR
jgi:hypothetical protein